MTSAEINTAWRRLAARLKYRGLLGEVFRALEVTKAGRLHLHVVNIETTERGGGFIHQAELSKLAEACGFGPICDVRAIKTGNGTARSVAEYLTKPEGRKQSAISKEAGQLAAYLAKSTAERRPDVAHKLGERLRPVNVSQGFSGGSLRETEREVCRHFAEAGQAEIPEAWELWQESEKALTTILRRSARRGASATEEAGGAPTESGAGDEEADRDESAPTEAKNGARSLELVQSRGNDSRRTKRKSHAHHTANTEARAGPAQIDPAARTDAEAA